MNGGVAEPKNIKDYADNYQGICLGFEIEDALTSGVIYEFNLISQQEAIDHIRSTDSNGINKFLLRLFTTKFDSWRYEDEVRVFFPLSDPDQNKAGMCFTDFTAGPVILREVIFGMNCDATSKALVAKLLEDYEPEVKGQETTRSDTKFEIIAVS